MSNLCDAVGGANLYGGFNYSFTTDRFGNLNSAIYFNSGFLQLPSGKYFTGDFTTTSWIYLISYQPSSPAVFDFGNGKNVNNVNLYTSKDSLVLYSLQGTNSYSIYSSKTLRLNTWYHVASVVQGTTGYIYINGVLASSGTVYAPDNILRQSNFIGKDNWLSSSLSNAIYDEIKIYSTALSADNINLDMSIGANNSKRCFIIFAKTLNTRS